mmetsp:Transcript_18427/g.50311  ORF Transcript_18427/g.50311 Transcript_18427/m.50311 type:complete len:120 (-) Transcript_18427:92-451(-)
MINNEFEIEKKSALDGWNSFCQNFEKRMVVSLRPEIFAKVATMLLADEQESVTTCEKLQEGIVEAGSSKSNFVTRKDIGLANADAEYHPLSIDPFKTTVRLFGKAVVAALSEKHNEGTV